VRELRERAGTTQETLAAAVNMSSQNLGHIERGQVRLSVDHLQRLAKALGCQPAELMPEGLALSPEQSELLHLFDQLDASRQKMLLRLAWTLLTEQGDGPSSSDERSRKAVS
jgi:transcriptional regulator with XRE-family HTH domain